MTTTRAYYLILATTAVLVLIALAITAATRVDPAPPPVPELAPDPTAPPPAMPRVAPTGEIIPAAIGGTATWYCSASSPCTRGYDPSDLVAAIDPTTGIARGDRVRVTHDGRSIDVTIVDVCACGGSRIIDLTSGAFAALAPDQTRAGREAFLDRGVIPVALEVGARPELTLPPTETGP